VTLSSVLSASENRDPNVLRIEDILIQVIARGIAARTNRTNGMLPFLNALKRGIVLRRLRQGQEAISIGYLFQMAVIQFFTR
jgi:hypothetical protein